MLNEKFILIAGPCVIESESIVMETAKKLKEITNKYIKCTVQWKSEVEGKDEKDQK